MWNLFPNFQIKATCTANLKDSLNFLKKKFKNRIFNIMTGSNKGQR